MQGLLLLFLVEIYSLYSDNVLFFSRKEPKALVPLRGRIRTSRSSNRLCVGFCEAGQRFGLFPWRRVVILYILIVFCSFPEKNQKR
jgi:hypothetical protein